MKIETPISSRRRPDYGDHTAAVRQEGVELWIVIFAVCGFAALIALAWWLLT